jgi:hypothetical protein
MRDAQSKGYDAMASAESKANASYLDRAEAKGKSLFSGAQAETERLVGHAKGDVSELKEVSLAQYGSYHCLIRAIRTDHLLDNFPHRTSSPCSSKHIAHHNPCTTNYLHPLTPNPLSAITTENPKVRTKNPFCIHPPEFRL